MDPYACPEVATPPLELIKEVLLYEWMRTHRIALAHWHEGQRTKSSWMNYKHHQQFDQWRSIAAYCQARVFQLNKWPLPIPYLEFPYEQRTIKYPPAHNWNGDIFHNGKVSINPQWLNTMRCHKPPGDPHLPPGWARVFKGKPFYISEPFDSSLLSRLRSGVQ